MGLHTTLGLKGRDRAMSPATCPMKMSFRPYLDASTFGDHDLPHAVEAVEVGLREARGQNGAPALREVASAWHWEEATLVRGLSLRVSHGNLPKQTLLRASQPACDPSPCQLLQETPSPTLSHEPSSCNCNPLQGPGPVRFPSHIPAPHSNLNSSSLLSSRSTHRTSDVTGTGLPT